MFQFWHKNYLYEGKICLKVNLESGIGLKQTAG